MAFSLFKKRKSGEVTLELGDNEFCTFWEEKADDVTADFSVSANSDHYNLLYRDGRYLGIPQFYGGDIYPFSDDPTKKGTNREKKKYKRAKIVCISKGTHLKLSWGTPHPFKIHDPATGKMYEVGANGVLYININTADAATNANLFYETVLSQGNKDYYNTENLAEFLRDAFLNHIGAKIEDYIHATGKPLSNFVGLTSSEILTVSKEICPALADIFDDYGVTIVQKASAGSVIKGFIVKEITPRNF